MLLIIVKTSAQINIKVGEKAPEINITDWIENVPTDKSLNGKYIVLEFWATWCGPCIAAVPHMNKIQEEFNQEDLYYISITDESIKKVKRSLKRINFNSIVVTDLTKKTQINYGDGVKGLKAYPLTVLIDKKGIIKWIGEPKKLDSSIMSTFLSKKKTKLNSEEKKSLGFKDIIRDKDLKYYFDIDEAKGTEMLKQAIGTSMFKLGSYRLDDIYNEILNVKKSQLELPEDLKNKRFDVTYKNIEKGGDLNMLERDILQKLNLQKKTKLKTTKTYIVSIQNKSLLEETLEKRFSAKSDADDKIIFTAYTINNTLDELSNVSSTSFKINEVDEVKYDFIIEIKSEKDIIESLGTYGLIVQEEDIEVEYVMLSKKE